MIRRPPRSTRKESSAASDVYKRQGLPYVISGLVAAGGMAAAMSTADGLILAIANAISHDVYYLSLIHI